MADNYLEKHYDDYRKRREAWLRKKGNYYTSTDRDPWSDA